MGCIGYLLRLGRDLVGYQFIDGSVVITVDISLPLVLCSFCDVELQKPDGVNKGA
jgi:hypothetical protein